MDMPAFPIVPSRAEQAQRGDFSVHPHGQYDLESDNVDGDGWTRLRTAVLPYILPSTGSNTTKKPLIGSETLNLVSNPVLTGSQADEPCDQYTPIELLDQLNVLTGYELLMEEPNLRKGLELLISGHHDFGRAYAWFRTAFILMELDVNLDETNFRNETVWGLRNQNPPGMVRKCIVVYSGLPNLHDCDSSLTTAIRPAEDAIDQRLTRIQQDINGVAKVMYPQSSHPRRLWDLLANRVIPYDWHARKSRVQDGHLRELRGDYVPFIALSHSWVHDFRRQSPLVNGKQWPVPLPPEVTCESLRDELLWFVGKSSGAPREDGRLIPPIYFEYCWLDALCLRQAWCNAEGTLLVDQLPTDITGHPLDYVFLEKTRGEEWMMDVPTIGGIYRRAQRIFVYLNGIGRKFKPVRDGDLNMPDHFSKAHLGVTINFEHNTNEISPFHWTRRAWTLQEWVLGFDGTKPIIMGGVKTAWRFWGEQARILANELGIDRLMPLALGNAVIPLEQGRTVRNGQAFQDIIVTMTKRQCSNPVDRIAGLLYYLDCDALPTFPAYRPDETPEQAWSRFLYALSNPWKFELSLQLPQPIDQLLPTWAAMMNLKYNELAFLANEQEYSTLADSPPIVGPVAIPCSFQLERPSKIHFKEHSGSVSSHRDETLFRSTLDFTLFIKLPSSTHPLPDGKYYLVPQIRLSCKNTPRRPSDYLKTTHINDIGTIDVTLMVCEPLITPAENGKWDGITLKKLGYTELDINMRGPKRFAYGTISQGQFFYELFNWEYFHCGWPWKEVLEDVTGFSEAQMRGKYGLQKVYSLIY